MEERQKPKFLPNPDAPRLSVIDECADCYYVFTKSDGENVCIPYYNPVAMWRNGCPMATNRVFEKVVEMKVNPLKASKKPKKGV